MAEYIERERFVDVLVDMETLALYEDAIPAIKNIRRLIDGIPADDVAPVRHGRWYKFMMVHIDPQTGIGIGQDMYKCSACNVGNEKTKMPYCPECGAKMDKEDTNGKTAD